MNTPRSFSVRIKTIKIQSKIKLLIKKAGIYSGKMSMDAKMNQFCYLMEAF